MNMALIGLGKMGYPLALNLQDNGWEPVVYNRTHEKVQAIAGEGVAGVEHLQAFASLTSPRAFWLMIPAGRPVDDMLQQLKTILQPGDCVIDGGNSHYKDTLRRYREMAGHQVSYVDVGTSGGVDGARHGACMMVGGEAEPVRLLAPILRSLCVPEGYAHVGGPGAGHYVKMVHNGIEYGMMQAIAEGFQVLGASDFTLDPAQVAHVWRHGSVIRSWLMDLTENVFREHGGLDGIKGVVNASGEGLWTLQEALEKEVPVPALSAAVFNRYRSKMAAPLADKLLAGLRFQFGGHSMELVNPEPETDTGEETP